MKAHIFSIVTAVILVQSAAAAIAINQGSWAQPVGGATLTGASSTGLIWGTGTAGSDNANNSFLWAVVDGDTNVQGNQNVTIEIGQTLVLTGIVQMLGVQTLPQGASQFRLGLYDSNGTTGAAGWSGYFIGNGTLAANPGRLYELNPGNSGYIAESSATTLTTFPGGGGNLTNGFYTFSLSLERTGATSMHINASLTRQSDGTSFALADWEDTTASINQVNRIGFLAGDGLDADGLILSNLSFTMIPEPTVSLMATLAGVMFLKRKRL